LVVEGAGMKVDFNRAALQEALSLVTSVVPSRTPKPILQCIKIAADKDTVRLYGTDLEIGIECQVTQVEVHGKGEVVVPADRVAAIVRESSDEVIAIESVEGTCHIRTADSHFTIYSHESSQYPRIPSFDGKADLIIELGELQEGIEQTVFAAAKESTRYALNGILWEVSAKKLLLVATDGRRLARRKLNLMSGPAETGYRIIVPAKTMSLLDRIGGDQKDKLSVRLIDNQILIGCANIVISSNLVEGNFPKYEDIIPSGYDKKAKFQTEAALSAVRRAALLTNEDSKGVKVAISNNRVVFSCRAPEMGDAQIDMAVEYSGEAIEIGFNPQFLVDVLRVLKTPDFDMELGQPDRPGLIKSGANFVYVVMPINLG
jgi:DNA polymerase III subunit beta